MMKNAIRLTNSKNKIMLVMGDCLKVMKEIPDSSVDLVLCDLPYGTTALNWDKVLDFKKLWEHYERVIKDNGVICLFGIQPFTSRLIVSNLGLYRYSWVWEKGTPTGHLNSNYKPLNSTEDICVFSKATIGSLSKNPIRYYAQGLTEVNIQKHNDPNSTWRKNKGYSSMNNSLNSDKPFVQKYTGYPNNVLKFSRDRCAVHPTQTPVALLEYLIRTYTRDGEVVLDNCMGSGSTGVACRNTDRAFIGIELCASYFEIAKNRIAKARP